MNIKFNAPKNGRRITTRSGLNDFSQETKGDIQSPYRKEHRCEYWEGPSHFTYPSFLKESVSVLNELVQ